MTGREIAEWIEEHGAEDAEIYIEVRGGPFKPSSGFDVRWSEDCPCTVMAVLR